MKISKLFTKLSVIGLVSAGAISSATAVHAGGDYG